MEWSAETIVAAYAAIVATGALFLEVRRWFEEGVKLSISMMPRAGVIGGLEDDANTYFHVSVANRGAVPTTITHLAFLVFPSWWARWRRRPTQSFYVPRPWMSGLTPNIPQELKPGAQWMGLAHPDEKLRAILESGSAYVAIYTTSLDRPFLKRIEKPAEPPVDAEKVE
jgi:hypothetical protein